MDVFFQLLFNGAFLGLLYAVSALGLVMVFRSSRVINLAHGEWMVMGAFLFLALSSWAGLPFLLSLVLALAGSFFLGILLEKGMVRPLVGAHPVQILLLTLGLAVFLRGLLSFLLGHDRHTLSVFLPENLSLQWGTFQMPPVYGIVLLFGLLFLLVFGFFFRYSSQGIYLQAMADNPHTARSLGVPIRRFRALSWAIAALACGISGIFFGMIHGLNVHELAAMGLKVFAVAILGGVYSIPGAILAGLMLGLLETFVGGYLSASLSGIFPYFVLILVLLVRPRGLFRPAVIRD